MNDDPYVYPGTKVLRNKENIRDAADLEQFERLSARAQAETMLRDVPLTYAGYRSIHRHLFGRIYDWAGEERTVELAKGNSVFCLVPYITQQMHRRFELLRTENGLKGLGRETFARRAAEHIGEINAIHPFREGNGRTQRAFLECLALQAGHEVDLALIEPEAWIEASIRSFQAADHTSLRDVIAKSMVQPVRERSQRHSPKEPEPDLDYDPDV